MARRDSFTNSHIQSSTHSFQSSTPITRLSQMYSNISANDRNQTADFNNGSRANSRPDIYFVEDIDEISVHDTSHDADQLNTTKSSGAEVVGIYETDANDLLRDDDDHYPKLNVQMRVTPFNSQNDFDDVTYNQESDKERIESLEKQTQLLETIVNDLQNQVALLTSRLEKIETKDEPNIEVAQSLKNNNFDLGASNVSFDRSSTPQTIYREQTSPSRLITNLEPEIQSLYAARESYRNSYNTVTRSPNSSRINNNNNETSFEKKLYKNLDNSFQTDSSRDAHLCPGPRHHKPSSPSRHVSPKKSNTSFSSMLSLASSNIAESFGGLGDNATSCSVSNISLGAGLTRWSSLSDILPIKNKAQEVLYDEYEKTIRLLLYNALITMRVPNWIDYPYDIDKLIKPPQVKLKLDWVNGYRGRDCRANVHYLPTGECVYFVSSIVVLYNIQDNTQRHYLGHTDNLKCIAVHPNKLMIASGQSPDYNEREKRPIVRVWNSVTLATIRIINFNEEFARSICCLAFSKHDSGTVLAVVDESSEHTITLVDWRKEKNWRITEGNSGPDPVLAVEFHPIDKFKLVTVGKSNIQFWDTRGFVMSRKSGSFDKYDKPKYVQCLTINDSGDAITGDSNGNIIVWPNESHRPRKLVPNAHTGGVFSIITMRDGTYLSGGKDRKIIEWDQNLRRTGRQIQLSEHCGGIRYIAPGKGMQVVVGTLRNYVLVGSLKTDFNIVMHGHVEATSCLVTHPLLNQYITGGYDEQIRLFDYRNHTTLWSKCIMTPATSACFSNNGSTLVVGSDCGKWMVLDALSQEILFSKSDGSGTITCMKFSPNSELFCFGSTDGQIYIYSTDEMASKFYYIGSCIGGHTNAIKEIDWSEDSQFIQSQSVNFELVMWQAKNCTQLENLEILDDLTWFTHNCTIGFSVFGSWLEKDPSLVNYCDKSNKEDILATVTDKGYINLFEYPASYNQCISQKIHGHTEKYNFIKFSSDDSRLIAVGSKSCLTTTWLISRTN